MTAAPKFRVGQTVKARSSSLRIDGLGDPLVECRILYPLEDWGYFVVTESGGFAALPAEDAIGDDEIPSPPARSGIGVVFYGNGGFAVPVLEMLVGRGYDVRAAVTMPDARRGRGAQSRPSPVKEFASRTGLTVLQPRDLEDAAFAEALRLLSPDIGVAVDFRILPRSVFSAPPLGTINLHSSLLPEYRGCSTVSGAIRDGSRISGVSTFVIDEGIDRGDVINNYAVGIGSDDDFGSVMSRLAECGPAMVDDAVLRMSAGLPPVPQSLLCNEFSEPGYAPKTDPRSLSIPWYLQARRVRDFIRAYAPSPGAWTDVLRDGCGPARIRVLASAGTGIPRGAMAPGEIAFLGRRLCIACGDFLLSIERLQFPGGRPLSGAECMNGHPGLDGAFCLHSSVIP